MRLLRPFLCAALVLAATLPAQQAAPLDAKTQQQYERLLRHRYTHSATHEIADLPDEVWQSRLRWLDEQAASFDARFRQRLFAEVRDGHLDCAVHRLRQRAAGARARGPGGSVTAAAPLAHITKR